MVKLVEELDVDSGLEQMVGRMVLGGEIEHGEDQRSIGGVAVSG